MLHQRIYCHGHINSESREKEIVNNYLIPFKIHLEY